MPIISGGGGGGAVFNGGTITNPLVIDLTADLVDRTALSVKEPVAFGFTVRPFEFLAGGFTSFAQATTGDLTTGGTNLGLGGAQLITQNGLVEATDVGGNIRASVTATGFRTSVITSGALPTVAPVSATAFQCSTTRDVILVVPFTGDATNNAATLKIELSPDNVTFSTLDTLSIAAALNLTGAINVPVSLGVPSGWYVKLTATHGTIGTATYY